MSRTWVIVPLYNEVQVVEGVVRELRETFQNVVCVDDGSVDGSGSSARAGGAIVVTHPINLGAGAAMRTGLDFALQDPSAEYFVTFDSDGQHRVEDALAMVERLSTSELDILIGSRFLGTKSNASVLKRIVLKAGVWFERMTTGVKLTDAHNGLRVMNRHSATSIRILQNRMAHASEVLTEISRNKLRYAEQAVQIVYTDYSRAKGQSVLNSVNIVSDLMFK